MCGLRNGRSVLWRALEEESGRSVLTLTGGVDHGPKEALSPVHAALRRAGEQAQFLATRRGTREVAGASVRFNWLFHPNAGRVHADDAVGAFQEAATKLGADVRTAFGSPTSPPETTASPLRKPRARPSPQPSRS